MPKSPSDYMIQKEQKITWWNETCKLSEGVSKVLAFSFCSKDNLQCHDFIHCKDYLQDAILCQLYKRHTAQDIAYGFKFTEANPSIYLAQTRMLIANGGDANFKDKLPSVLDFMHQIEKKLKMTLTKCVPCAEPPIQYIKSGVWLLRSNKRWIKSPPMISLYSLLVRIAFCHKLETSYKDTINGVKDGTIAPYLSNDKARLAGCLKGFDFILNEGDKSVFSEKIEENYPEKIPIYTMHNSMGIVSFSSGVTRENCPAWKSPKAITGV